MMKKDEVVREGLDRREFSHGIRDKELNAKYRMILILATDSVRRG
jgi:hypothetical protein